MSGAGDGKLVSGPARRFLRPLGVLWSINDASNLAGGWLAPQAAEWIKRDGGRRAVALDAIDLGDSRLAAMMAPRKPLAGLSLHRPRIMGIVNLTPDSFSDGGSFAALDDAVQRGLQLIAEGADVLDLGAESTRPGSDAVPLDQELARLLPVIKGIRARSPIPISVDTRKADVMRQAIAAGATIINDVSALTYDPLALETVAALDVPVVLMHAQGDPKTMQNAPRYDDVLFDVLDWLADRIEACERGGIKRDRIIVDPGIGFGKTLEHNLALMSGLSAFHSLGVPVLLGASRKRFIGAISGVAEPRQRIAGSLAAVLAGCGAGVQIVRVHDVQATREALDVWLASVSGEWRERPRR